MKPVYGVEACVDLASNELDLELDGQKITSPFAVLNADNWAWLAAGS